MSSPVVLVWMKRFSMEILLVSWARVDEGVLIGDTLVPEALLMSGFSRKTDSAVGPCG